MFSVFKKSQVIITDIESFFDTIDQGAIMFEEGMMHYLNQNDERFEQVHKKINDLEGKADKLKTQTTSALYTYSLLPDLRGDILKLLERMDDLIDTMKDDLSQFDTERPEIPESIKPGLLELARLSARAAQEAVEAARTFFRHPVSVRDKVARINLIEHEADKVAQNIKRKLFHDMTDLPLPNKMHLRYFTLHIETVSDIAESVGDMLGIMAIKRFS
jgi:hypothetical protein